MTAPRGVFVGLATLDVLHAVDRPPGPNEKVTARARVVAAGGPAANAAVTPPRTWLADLAADPDLRHEPDTASWRDPAPG